MVVLKEVNYFLYCIRLLTKKKIVRGFYCFGFSFLKICKDS